MHDSRSCGWGVEGEVGEVQPHVPPSMGPETHPYSLNTLLSPIILLIGNVDSQTVCETGNNVQTTLVLGEYYVSKEAVEIQNYV